MLESALVIDEGGRDEQPRTGVIVFNEPQWIPFQTDKGYLGVIQRAGCVFLSYLYVACDEKKKPLSVDQVNEVFGDALEARVVRGDGTVNDPDWIFRKMGVKLSGFCRHAPATMVVARPLRIVRQYRNNRTGYSHAVVGYPELDRIQWDSLQNSVTVREGFSTQQIVIPILK
jgi:hypothetical protein